MQRSQDVGGFMRRYYFIGAMLLLIGGSMATAIAAEEQAPSVGHFLDPGILAFPAASPRGMVGSSFGKGSPVLHDLTVSPDGWVDRYEDYRVASSVLTDGRGEVQGSLVVVNRDNGEFLAMLEAPHRSGLIAGDRHGLQRMRDAADDDGGNGFKDPDGIENPRPPKPADRAGKADVDSKGFIVIDVFAGFSEAAVKKVGDAKAYALAQVASVNRALQNSKVQKVRLRLVGVRTIKQDFIISAENLDKSYDLFEQDMFDKGADLFAGFFDTTAEDGTEGMAWTGGRASMQTVKFKHVFKHEIGHIVGGHHCAEGDASYRHGYDNGKSLTILCSHTQGYQTQSKRVNYYSNPAVKDTHGVALGKPGVANMARLWRERAEAMSAEAEAVVPLN